MLIFEIACCIFVWFIFGFLGALTFSLALKALNSNFHGFSPAWKIVAIIFGPILLLITMPIGLCIMFIDLAKEL